MYKLDDLSYEEIFDYIDKFNYVENISFDKFRQEAQEQNVPIIKKDVENFLKTFLLMTRPKKILEIGCAVGYSSLFMSSVLRDDVIIDTLEISEDMKRQAQENFEKFGNKNINVILGDALETIPKLEDGKYDMVFMDAGKGHYYEFYKLVLDKLDKNGIILCDNILFRGHLCKQRLEIPRRLRTIHKRMNMFFNQIKCDKNISYDLLPLGDGVLIIKLI